MNICQNALTGKKRTTLQTKDCKDVVVYYQTVDAAFIVSLEKVLVGLTPQNKSKTRSTPPCKRAFT